MKRLLTASWRWWTMPLSICLLLSSTQLSANPVRSTAHSTVSITRVPALSVTQVRNDEMVFNAANLSQQSYVRLDSGGQSFPYRLAASYREAQDGEEISITQSHGEKPYSVYWSDQQRRGVSLEELVTRATVMQADNRSNSRENILVVKRDDPGVISTGSGSQADTLILTFVIE